MFFTTKKRKKHWNIGTMEHNRFLKSVIGYIFEFFVVNIFKNFLKTDVFQEQIEQENIEACFEALLAI
jgi:hypothetical protein